MTDKKLKKLLQILGDGEYHSGNDLGEKLGVTRAAVWKLIQQIKELGINIEAKTNLGYCIPGGMELLSTTQIKKNLSPQYQSLIKNLDILNIVDSTNNYLLNKARSGTSDIAICLAENMTAGRGRFGRQWVSCFGKNIYLSLLWHFKTDISKLLGLSNVVAVAVARALQKYGVSEHLGLKWPNDIQWQGHKLAGILIELHGESHHHSHAVIGIGLNLDLISQLSTKSKIDLIDLLTITGKKPQRNQLSAYIIEAVIDALKKFQLEGLQPFITEWIKLDVALNQPVKIIAGQKEIKGIYRGIDSATGELVLEEKGGNLQRYSSGEVSLRF